MSGNDNFGKLPDWTDDGEGSGVRSSDEAHCDEEITLPLFRLGTVLKGELPIVSADVRNAIIHTGGDFISGRAEGSQSFDFFVEGSGLEGIESVIDELTLRIEQIGDLVDGMVGVVDDLPAALFVPSNLAGSESPDERALIRKIYATFVDHLVLKGVLRYASSALVKLQMNEALADDTPGSLKARTDEVRTVIATAGNTIKSLRDNGKKREGVLSFPSGTFTVGDHSRRVFSKIVVGNIKEWVDRGKDWRQHPIFEHLREVVSNSLDLTGHIDSSVVDSAVNEIFDPQNKDFLSWLASLNNWLAEGGRDPGVVDFEVKKASDALDSFTDFMREDFLYLLEIVDGVSDKALGNVLKLVPLDFVFEMRDNVANLLNIVLQREDGAISIPDGPALTASSLNRYWHRLNMLYIEAKKSQAGVEPTSFAVPLTKRRSSE